MDLNNSHNLLLRTKLNRPPVPVDYLWRPGLVARLDAARHHPLILISAPAGYGKSTLVSCWLGECDRPAGWLSLDQGDNDLQQFLNGFVVAVQSIFPEFLQQSLSLIASPTLPPPLVIATTLVNELERLENDFIVVLDDIHVIRDQEVLNFLKLLFRYPARTMQLVVVGRRDPVIPIASLRANGMLTELRMVDLRFTLEESLQFIGQAEFQAIEMSLSMTLAEKTEGWPAGLRLGVLAIQGQQDTEKALKRLSGTNQYIMDYLINEVLEQQSDGERTLLLIMSLFDRFSASLCDIFAETVEEKAAGYHDGRGFINWLLVNNLFIIPLDTEQCWFRYHHLFRELLYNQLKHEISGHDISRRYLLASNWCEQQGLITEALQYALSAGKEERAADIVERHRETEFNANRWYVVKEWLALLPEKIRRNRVKLLLTEVRLLNERFRLLEIPPVMDRIKVLLEHQERDPGDEGELYFYQGYMCFWQGDGVAAQGMFEQALQRVPENTDDYLRAELSLYVGLTAHINGRSDQGLAILRRWIDQDKLQSGVLWERLTFGLATLPLMLGDLALAQRQSERLLADGQQTGKGFIISWANYLLGNISFHRFDLAEARQYFGMVLNHRYVANMRVVIDSMAAMALICQFTGEDEEADQMLNLADDYARWAGDPMLFEVILGCKARLGLLRRDADSVRRWQRGFDIEPHVPAMLFFIATPWITECMVLASTGIAKDRIRAKRRIEGLEQGVSSLQYICQNIDILSLQCLITYQEGNLEAALDQLRALIGLAEPGEWIRPFVELGQPMADLLLLLQKRGAPSPFINRILAAFPSMNREAKDVLRTAIVGGEDLTLREMDVLELLTDRLQNKEIAASLSISPVTVKTHLRTIYQKLDVSGRREASQKAVSLGLFRNN